MNETLTRPCAGGCGAHLFVFAGFEAIGRKADEWDQAMLWLDRHDSPTSVGTTELSLEGRLDRLYDELTR